MGLKLGGRRTEGLARACAERRASGGPSGGEPATCRVHGAKALGEGPARIQVPLSSFGGTTPDAARRQRREGRHAGARFAHSLCPSCTSTAPTLLGVRHGLGGSGRTSQASSARDAPCTRARPLCRPQGLHTARCRGHHAHPGPRSRVQPPPAPLTAGRWRAAVQNPAKSRSHPWHVARGSRRGTGGLQMAWQGDLGGHARWWGHAQAAATLDWHASWQGGGALLTGAARQRQ
jgi:hypothetical protein